MGVGADWTRVKFTLDASVCEAVTRLFVKLHKFVDCCGSRTLLIL
jgi:valyl-tRNA synthetase